MTRRTYSELARLGLRLAGEGFKVIRDAKYDRLEQRREVIERAGERGLPLNFVLCSTDIATMKQRLKDRVADVSDATSDRVDRQAADFEDFTDAERALTIEVDTTETVDYDRLAEEIGA